MNKENIEQIERIENKFSYVPLIVVFLMVLSLLFLAKLGIKVVSPLDIILIGMYMIMFFNQIFMKLQMKSLLRILKNESK